HTNGRRIIGAESFTANPGEDWHQYPGSMKDQLDWALCTGINKFVIHRYQHQPELDQFPGMTMGPYGVHWERTQTWWDMVPAFHTYVARCSQMLRQGLPVDDILYLTPEGAPQVFTPPASALTSGFPDKKSYSFDGCSPENLMAHALVHQGRVTFPDGMSYRLLVLPTWATMTPGLLTKIVQLVQAGATVTGSPPVKSPSLSDYPAADTALHTLSAQLWGTAPYAASRAVGKGHILLTSAGTVMQVDQARWIWFPEGNPAASAPVGKRFFQTTRTIAPGQTIKSGMALITADNSYILFVNGHRVGSGDDFHALNTLDMTPWLKTGANDIRITAENTGDTPNPAGVIGAFAITCSDGSVQKFGTDSHWQSSQSPDGPQSPAMDLGPVGMGPWSLSQPVAPIYPDYLVTASILKQMGVAPDFSSDAPMRYIHRHLSGSDVYFIANPGARPILTTATFRIAGCQPEWWNPLTGETRDLPKSSSANGLTHIPLRLASHESGFVVFRKPLTAPINAGTNFPQYRSVLTLTQPWTVAFDPKWGGPASIKFAALDDWSKRPEPGIKYYSGKAVYTTSFALPAGSSLRNTPGALALGTVKNLASVRLNGKSLGIVWCDPWRVSIPAGMLKPTGNTLEITVANLWINRLIGDSGKPQSERLTSTTGNDYSPNSPLESSGLLGPVTVGTLESTK
ncbi:MAG: glycosyl hydrolase, partial [Janthinobacterium lividum]